MKKLILLLILTASTAFAEQVTYKDIYYALRHYESIDGKVMFAKDRRHWGFIHTGKATLQDYNKRNPRDKIYYDDLWNENKCFKLMVDHMVHYSKAYKKRGGIPDARYLYSLWRHGNRGTIKKGKWNRYSTKLMSIMREQMNAREFIRKSQKKLYAGE